MSSGICRPSASQSSSKSSDDLVLESCRINVQNEEATQWGGEVKDDEAVNMKKPERRWQSCNKIFGVANAKNVIYLAACGMCLRVDAAKQFFC
jgi:hypothetical protein